MECIRSQIPVSLRSSLEQTVSFNDSIFSQSLFPFQSGINQEGIQCPLVTMAFIQSPDTDLSR